MTAPAKTDLLPSPADFASSTNGNEIDGDAPIVETWRPRFWDNDVHVALQFATTEELDAAIDWLWTTPVLRRLPRVHVGQNTMIVPAQTADLFRARGFQFVLGTVTSMGDLSPEEANRIRKTG